MLTTNRTKYLAMIAGIAIASLLIAQQSSIFCGVMLWTSSPIRDVSDANIWAMDPNVRFVDDIKRLPESRLLHVRAVEGVQWAAPYFKTLAGVDLRDGNSFRVFLIGLDDATLIGAPPKMLAGSITDLYQPDAVIIDKAGYEQLWPGEPFRSGKVVEIYGQRAVIVGLCHASRRFQTFPILYTLYGRAKALGPRPRKPISFLLVKSKSGLSPRAVCNRIEEETGLRALTKQEFEWQTMQHVLQTTGVLLNFGTTALLGLLVGISIAGTTFHVFTAEHIVQFATLKAIGVRDGQLVRLILVQAIVVGSIGYCLGVGSAVLFGEFIESSSSLAFHMPWQVLVGTGLAVLVIVCLVSILSIRTVLRVEPAVVMQR